MLCHFFFSSVRCQEPQVPQVASGPSPLSSLPPCMSQWLALCPSTVTASGFGKAAHSLEAKHDLEASRSGGPEPSDGQTARGGGARGGAWASATCKAGLSLGLRTSRRGFQAP